MDELHHFSHTGIIPFIPVWSSNLILSPPQFRAENEKKRTLNRVYRGANVYGGTGTRLYGKIRFIASKRIFPESEKKISRAMRGKNDQQGETILGGQSVSGGVFKLHRLPYQIFIRRFRLDFSGLRLVEMSTSANPILIRKGNLAWTGIHVTCCQSTVFFFLQIKTNNSNNNKMMEKILGFKKQETRNCSNYSNYLYDERWWLPTQDLCLMLSVLCQFTSTIQSTDKTWYLEDFYFLFYFIFI